MSTHSFVYAVPVTIEDESRGMRRNGPPPPSGTGPGRAQPLPAEERREALVDATMRALREQRRPLSTREIAQAAGVAEGTIFRSFASKDDLIDAVVAKAFGPKEGALRVEDIDLDRPLRDRLIDFVAILQEQLQNVFGLMEALGMSSPPATECDPEADARRADRVVEALTRLVGPDTASLRVDPAGLFRYLRLLTFSGSHAGISDGDTMTPAEIVEVVLNGVTRRADTENSVATSTPDDIASAGSIR